MKLLHYLLPAMTIAAPLLELGPEPKSGVQLINNQISQEPATLVLEQRSPKSKPKSKGKPQPPKAALPKNKPPTTPVQTPKAPAKPTKTSAASSAKPSSTIKTSSVKPTPTKADYVCGVGCGKKGCPIKAKPTSKSKPGKSGKVTRSLKDIAIPGRQQHVRDTIKANQEDELEWNIVGTSAVSKHGKFGSAPLTAWVRGIEGCTGVAIVSDHGYWLAHFIESAMVDTTLVEWKKLINVAQNGDKAKKPPPFNDQVRYTVPSTLTSIFGAGSNPKIYLMKPKRGTEQLHTAKINEIMKHIKEGILSSAPVTEFKYEKPDGDEKDAISRNTARGKMLVEYDNDQKGNGATTQNPQKAKSRLWMETNPHENDWIATPSQQNGAPEEPEDEPESSGPKAPEYRETCSTEEKDALTDAEAEEAITSFCDARIIKLEPGVLKDIATASGKKFKLGAKMSSDQKGCNTTASKMKSLQNSTTCRAEFRKAIKRCPNDAGTGFKGLKPVIWNSPLGCVEFTAQAA